MSDAQGGYKLDEAQAVLRETKAIKKAITCGEKEKQDLIKVTRAPRDVGPWYPVYKDFKPAPFTHRTNHLVLITGCFPSPNTF